VARWDRLGGMLADFIVFCLALAWPRAAMGYFPSRADVISPVSFITPVVLLTTVSSAASGRRMHALSRLLARERLRRAPKEPIKRIGWGRGVRV